MPGAATNSNGWRSIPTHSSFVDKGNFREVANSMRTELDKAFSFRSRVTLELAELNFVSENDTKTKTIPHDSVINIFDKTVVIPVVNTVTRDTFWTSGTNDNTGKLTYIGNRSLTARVYTLLNIIGVDTNKYKLNIYKEPSGEADAIIIATKAFTMVNTNGGISTGIVDLVTEIDKNDTITAKVTSLGNGASSAVIFLNAQLSIQPLKILFPIDS